MQSETVQKVRDQLNARKGDWPSICQATGLGYSWLCKFAQGRIPSPGVVKIEKLSSHLSQPTAA